MFFKALAVATLATLALTTQAEAHSAYWECAAHSGSNEAAVANCGTRADYDRREAEASQEQYRRDQQEREIRDQQERINQLERDRQDQIRREDDLRRQQDQINARNSANNSQGSYTPSYPSSNSSDGMVRVPVELNTHVVNATVNVGKKANLGRFDGSSIIAARVDLQAKGPATIKVLIQGQSVGSFKVKAGTTKKAFTINNAVIDRNASNFVLAVKGDVTVKRVIFVVQ